MVDRQKSPAIKVPCRQCLSSDTPFVLFLLLRPRSLEVTFQVDSAVVAQNPMLVDRSQMTAAIARTKDGEDCIVVLDAVFADSVLAQTHLNLVVNSASAVEH